MIYPEEASSRCFLRATQLTNGLAMPVCEVPGFKQPIGRQFGTLQALVDPPRSAGRIEGQEWQLVIQDLRDLPIYSLALGHIRCCQALRSQLVQVLAAPARHFGVPAIASPIRSHERGSADQK